MGKTMQDLIPHTIDDNVIDQRVKDGYFNATAMCKAAGKRWNNYTQNDTTQEFLAELEADAGIPASELIQSVRGGFPELQGTWVHPHVAMHLAQWLSPRFAVQVSKWVYDWMSRPPPGRAALPYHLDRYIRNYRNVPPGHFSILTEVTLLLIAPLDVLGYQLPEAMWPDISEGKIFAGWLRAEYGIETLDLPTYLHVFADGRPSVRARAYPNSLLADFRAHFENVWLPTRAATYFKTRDPIALTFLPKLLPSPESSAA